ncbi:MULTISPECIES: hypothetical protein [unclassified Serratia (in: enterobacteria)]|uniref:hypothetical protein n=1 Tax=unclassified Serratia (in: enterobacteria) TaxID=2647522 RepID=UPI0030766922
MGRSIPVNIGQQTFASQKAAVSYFMDQREAIKEKGPVKDGAFFDELKDLYNRYCDCSPEWDRPGLVIQTFFVDHEPRKNGQTWASHLCYWVRFSPKQALPFSVEKAVKAIVKASAEVGQ